jgi:hypothetical protein
MDQSLPENPAELDYVHLYSSEDEMYLVNRALSYRERPTDHVCYTIPEAQVLRWIGTDVMGVVQLVKALLVAPVVRSRRNQTEILWRSTLVPASG